MEPMPEPCSDCPFRLDKVGWSWEKDLEIAIDPNVVFICHSTSTVTVDGDFVNRQKGRLCAGALCYHGKMSTRFPLAKTRDELFAHHSTEAARQERRRFLQLQLDKIIALGGDNGQLARQIKEILAQ